MKEMNKFRKLCKRLLFPRNSALLYIVFPRNCEDENPKEICRSNRGACNSEKFDNILENLTRSGFCGRIDSTKIYGAMLNEMKCFI